MDMQDIYESARNSIVLVDAGDGCGTGFCARPDGLFVTNAHVTGSASEVALHTTEGLEFEGTVIAVERNRDIAVIHCADYDEKILPPLNLLRDGMVRVGDPVIAIGHPDNSANFSLTQGVISSLPRSNDRKGFLQLNLSINWGNSGGPILSSTGFVLGVAVQIVLTNDGNRRIEGISRAIPLSAVIAFLDGIPPLTQETLNANHYCFSCGRFVSNSKYCPNCGWIAAEASEKKVKRTANNISKSTSTCPACGQNKTTDAPYCNRCGSRI